MYVYKHIDSQKLHSKDHRTVPEKETLSDGALPFHVVDELLKKYFNVGTVNITSD
jgi:hypothetical protein